MPVAYALDGRGAASEPDTYLSALAGLNLELGRVRQETRPQHLIKITLQAPEIDYVDRPEIVYHTETFGQPCLFIDGFVQGIMSKAMSNLERWGANMKRVSWVVSW